MRMARLVRLYPAAWRARYGAEYVALLEAQRASPWIVLEVVYGALDAHVRALARRGRARVNRVRTSEIAVFCAYIGFVFAGMGFQKMTEYDDFMDAARTHADIGAGYMAVVVGAAVALLAVLAGGVPLALAAMRYALATNRRDIPLLFGVPVLAFGALLGYIALAKQLSQDHSGGPTATDHVLFGGLATVLFVGAVASAWAVSAAIARAEISGRLLRYALAPASLATLAMAVMLIGATVWGIGLRAHAPQLWGGDDGILATSTALSWLAQVVLMAICTAVAAVGLSRALTTAREALAAV